MNEVEAVVVMIQALTAAGIEFMVVGSLSSNAYGLARSTDDADFVMQSGVIALSNLMEHLPDGFRLETQMGFETVTTTTRHRLHYTPLRFMFELFEVSDDPHDQMRFANRVKTTYGGAPVYMPRAEDVVITKLRWSLGGETRRKDIDDVRNVLAIQQGKLDMDYIKTWCGKHGTSGVLEKILQSIQSLPGK